MRIIVAVTGATGVQMSETLLRALRQQENCEIHLIVSEGAKLTWHLECEQELTALYDLADYVYEEHDLAAVIASGSFVTDGMIVMPCSMKTLAGIVSGYAENLIQRAADVCLKEGRKVVLVPREMPLGKIHLKNLKKAAGLGCAIVPPMLTFYNGAQTLQAQVEHVVGKVLLQFHMEYQRFVSWKGQQMAQDGRENAGRESVADGRMNMLYSASEEKADHESLTDFRKNISSEYESTSAITQCSEVLREDICIGKDQRKSMRENIISEQYEMKEEPISEKEIIERSESYSQENTRKEKELRSEDTSIKTSINIDEQFSFGSLSLQAQRIGDDLQILLWGGSRPHIGCVVLASPRPSLRGDGQMSSTSSVINRSGHKDEQICRAVADQVAAATGRTIVCSGGFHIDGIQKSQIQEVQEAVQQVTRELIAELSAVQDK